MRRTCLVAALVACGGPAPPAPDATEPVLAPSLSVSVADSALLRLDVTNTTDSAVVLDFGTAQRVDFVVQDEAGQELWRWSEGMGFAQVVGSEILGAGETRSWRATWDPAGRPGPFHAVARLVSTSHPLELRTPFELPPD